MCFLQNRHLYFKIKKEIKGILSNHLIFFLHRGQKDLLDIISKFFGKRYIQTFKKHFYIWHSNAFLIFLTSMEIIINSPGFYLHIQDAIVFVQYCIDGILNFTSQFKI